MLRYSSEKLRPVAILALVVFALICAFLFVNLIVQSSQAQSQKLILAAAKATSISSTENASPTDRSVVGTETPIATDQTPPDTDTPTPTDWWYRDYPPEKRAYFETLVAEQATIVSLPTVWRPTRVIPTTAPIVLDGQKMGDGFFLADAMMPGKGSYDYSGGAWGVTVGDEVTIVFAGSYVNDPTQGIVQVVGLSRLDGSPTHKPEVFDSPEQLGQLTIKDAEGMVLILSSEKGTDVRFDVSKEQFVP